MIFTIKQVKNYILDNKLKLYYYYLHVFLHI